MKEFSILLKGSTEIGRDGRITVDGQDLDSLIAEAMGYSANSQGAENKKFYGEVSLVVEEVRFPPKIYSTFRRPDSAS